MLIAVSQIMSLLLFVTCVVPPVFPLVVPPEVVPPLLVTLVLGLTANTIVLGCWFFTKSFFKPTYQPSVCFSPGLLIAVIICAFPLNAANARSGPLRWPH